MTDAVGSRLARTARSQPELLLLAGALVVGVIAHVPLRWIGDHQGINVLLAVLTLSSGLLVPAGSATQLRASGGRIALSLAAGGLLLPVLSWAISHLVGAGPLRHGVMGLGLAPSEIASVGATALAGGAAEVAAAVLVGSTIVSVALAGPVLAWEAGHSGVRPAHIVLTLVVVVAIPLAVGLLARSRVRRYRWATTIPAQVSQGALFALIALVAAQITFSRAYLGVLGAALAFLAGSILLAVGVGWGAPRGPRIGLLLSVSMRDFAIAAGIVASAFGPAAAAPLGIYGIVAIGWGVIAAGRLRDG